MATMIPDVPLGGALEGAEGTTYVALRSLPDEYRIYHSVAYCLAPGTGVPAREGEIDFLLLHPERGMLALEVKGGRIAWDGREQRWTSTDRNEVVHEIQDPFRQAQQNVKNLVKEIETRHVLGGEPPKFVHGHGVVFPDCEYTIDREPLAASSDLVIDASDLAGDLEARIERLYAYWASGRDAQPLTKRGVKRLGQQVLAPHFSLGLTLAGAIAWEERALALLSEEQSV